MILVTGGTGRTGSEVVRALMARGEPVRVLARDPAAARARLGDDVQVFPGDLQALPAAALDGVDRLFLSGPDDPRRIGWEAGLLDAAATAGVRRVVRLSSIGAEPGAPVGFWDWHGRMDAQLAASGLPAVVLRSSPFMSLLEWMAHDVVEHGALFAPAAGARIAMIDPRDVGAAAAAVLAGAGRDGDVHTLTGPAAVTFADMAAAVARATGRPVEFVAIDDGTARAALEGGGMPPVIVAELLGLFAQLRAGAAEPTTRAVRALTGREPRDITAWARLHAARFTPSPELIA